MLEREGGWHPFLCLSVLFAAFALFRFSPTVTSIAFVKARAAARAAATTSGPRERTLLEAVQATTVTRPSTPSASAMTAHTVDIYVYGGLSSEAEALWGAKEGREREIAHASDGQQPPRLLEAGRGPGQAWLGPRRES